MTAKTSGGTETPRDKFPQLIDRFLLISVVVSLVLTVVEFGLAGLVVYSLLLFTAYRLGKAVGR